MRRGWRAFSIQVRYTVVTTLIVLAVLAVLGPSLDLAIRYRVETTTFKEIEQTASLYSAAARSHRVPRVIPAFTTVDLIQLVDSHGRVVDSSRPAAGWPPLSRYRPAADDRFKHLTDCLPGHGCVLLMAIRVSPAADAPVVYVGTTEPEVLTAHRLELFVGVSAVLSMGVVAWLTWTIVGHTLRRVTAIRMRLSQITGTDLSLRVPVPHGNDEIALLAATANQTLARLEGAVEQQRQFASDTAHELRTPITGLQMRLEEATLYSGDIGPHDAIRAALSTTNRLEVIIDDLLVLSHPQTDRPAPPVPIELGALVIAEIDSRANEMPIHLQVTPDVWVHGCGIQLTRVIHNLVNNARRHARNRIEVIVAADDGQALVVVTDDGDGIAPHDRERIFERFTRLAEGRRRDPKGSGLGLAISREIAHAHGGTLRVEDSPHGARFVLRLPRLNPDRPSETELRCGGG